MKTPNLSHCTAYPGKVVDIFYGTEDRGILTCNVTCEGAWGGQGFGTLVLDERTGPEFKRGVMESFGVANFNDLIGKPCVLYRSQYTQLAEAIDGGCGIFSIDEFRSRMWPSSKGELSPRDRHVADLRQRRESLLRNAATLQDELDKLTL